MSSTGASTTLTTEAARTWAADPTLHWAVTDATTGAGFTVEPGEKDTDPRVTADGFSKFDALALRYRTNEIDDGISIGTGCAIQHEPWLNGEALTDTDVVLWYRSSSARTTGTCELRGPTLRPFGYTVVAVGPPAEDGMQAPVEVQAAVPNPFSSGTTVRFRVAQGQDVRVQLYDVLGRRVRTLFEAPVEADVYETVDVSSGDLPPGTYVVRVEGTVAAGSTRIVLSR